MFNRTTTVSEITKSFKKMITELSTVVTTSEKKLKELSKEVDFQNKEKESATTIMNNLNSILV